MQATLYGSYPGLFFLKKKLFTVEKAYGFEFGFELVECQTALLELLFGLVEGLGLLVDVAAALVAGALQLVQLPLLFVDEPPQPRRFLAGRRRRAAAVGQLRVGLLQLQLTNVPTLKWLSFVQVFLSIHSFCWK